MSQAVEFVSAGWICCRGQVSSPDMINFPKRLVDQRQGTGSIGAARLNFIKYCCIPSGLMLNGGLGSSLTRPATLVVPFHIRQGVAFQHHF